MINLFSLLNCRENLILVIMTLEDIIDFPRLSRFLDNLRAEIKTKLVGNVYIGSGSQYTDVINASCLHENLILTERYSVVCDNNKIYVVYPKNNGDIVELKMSNINIPVTTTEVDINNTTYYVVESKNTYTGTFNIKL